MKKAADKKPPETSLKRYDWSKAQRGRYAARFPRDAHAIVIEPELYEQYGSAAAINSALALLLQLRATLGKLPRSPRRKTKVA